MKFESILISREGPLAVLQFNRPEQYNALDLQMSVELLEGLLEIKNDPGVRALLITGSGKSFHSGGDIKFFNSELDNAPKAIDRLVIGFHNFISQLVRLPIPVVAAVNGPAAGAGFSIAMACDLVLAHQDAVFTMAYTRIGASPDGGSTFFLPRLLGLKRAMELTLTNRVLSAQEAYDWGIVNRVIGDEKFMDQAREFTMELANGPTAAFGRAKSLLNHSLNHDLEIQLEHEAREIVASAATSDFRENVKAFVQKRKNIYQGR